ncbi:hypothetical protein KC351_g55 [Hortaea werneckii]|nr:hypothetical protein KC351_g55 [Hortaea werneckii]
MFVAATSCARAGLLASLSSHMDKVFRKRVVTSIPSSCWRSATSCLTTRPASVPSSLPSNADRNSSCSMTLIVISSDSFAASRSDCLPLSCHESTACSLTCSYAYGAGGGAGSLGPSSVGCGAGVPVCCTGVLVRKIPPAGVPEFCAT